MKTIYQLYVWEWNPIAYNYEQKPLKAYDTKEEAKASIKRRKCTSDRMCYYVEEQCIDRRGICTTSMKIMEKDAHGFRDGNDM